MSRPGHTGHQLGGDEPSASDERTALKSPAVRGSPGEQRRPFRIVRQGAHHLGVDRFGDLLWPVRALPSQPGFVLDQHHDHFGAKGPKAVHPSEHMSRLLEGGPGHDHRQRGAAGQVLCR